MDNENAFITDWNFEEIGGKKSFIMTGNLKNICNIYDYLKVNHLEYF